MRREEVRERQSWERGREARWEVTTARREGECSWGMAELRPSSKVYVLKS